MILTKITLAALVGALAVVGGLGIGVGIGAGIWSTSSKSTEMKKVYLVTDGGTIADKSFNEQAYDAIKSIYSITTNKKVGDEVYIRPSSTSAKDISVSYASAISNMTSDGVIIAPGYYHISAIKDYQKANPNSKTRFVLLDGAPRYDDFDNNIHINFKNTIGITFDTKKAGFRAGYLSGLYLQEMGDATPTVGLWGGGDFPGVTDFMVGYVAGIAYYNSNNGSNTDVKFAKFGDPKDYVNSGFDAGKGKVKAQHLLDKSTQKDNTADILLPVAGPQTNDAITAINENADKDRIKVIGVDTDQSKKYSKDSDKFLTSITKNVKKAAIAGVFYWLGLPNDLENPINNNYDASSKHFQMGLEKGYTGYVEQFDKNTRIKPNKMTWGQVYSLVTHVTPTMIDNTTIQINPNVTVKLSQATWANALAYITAN